MNSRNTELVSILIDLQKLSDRFTDTCSRMTAHERKSSKSTIPMVESRIYEAAGGISDLILDYFPTKL